MMCRHRFRRAGSVVLLLSLLYGCQADTVGDALSDLPADARQANARKNILCLSLSASEVREIVGAPLAETAALSPTTNWCRFTLKDKRWFDIAALRIGKVGEIAADCYDEQNSPTAYKRIYHPHCFAVTNGWQLRVQGDPRPSISKPDMLRLLRLSLEHLNRALQQPPEALFGGKA
jgi:hypothetical protein